MGPTTSASCRKRAVRRSYGSAGFKFGDKGMAVFWSARCESLLSYLAHHRKESVSKRIPAAEEVKCRWYTSLDGMVSRCGGGSAPPPRGGHGYGMQCSVTATLDTTSGAMRLILSSIDERRVCDRAVS